MSRPAPRTGRTHRRPCGADHLHADRAVPGLRDRHQLASSRARRSSPSRWPCPTPGTFDLVGYTTVLKQGDFFLYFQNSMIVTVASLFFVLLFGAMAAFALSRIPLPRQHADGALSGARHHDPDPPRHRGDPAADGRLRPRQHADGADPRLHRAGPAAGRLHPVGVHEAGLGRPEERRPHRRASEYTHLLPPRPAAGAPGDGDGRGLHHDPDLERPVVPADPRARPRRPRPSPSARRSSSASSSPTGTRCSPRCRSPSCRCWCST